MASTAPTSASSSVARPRASNSVMEAGGGVGGGSGGGGKHAGAPRTLGCSYARDARSETRIPPLALVLAFALVGARDITTLAGLAPLRRRMLARKPLR